MRILASIAFAVAFAGTLLSQDAQQAKPEQPQVRVNYLNVCSPSDAEKAEIAAVLERLPAKPRFSPDFEIARGRSTMEREAVAAGQGAKLTEATPPMSRWVRIRKEFPDNSPFLNVQYSFSVGDSKADEVLVFRLRDPKEVMQVSLSDSATATSNPAQAVAAGTPADRIRLERFGKSSLVLARCKDGDQSAYEPLFQKASSLLSLYRDILGARRVVHELPSETTPSSSAVKTKPKQ